MHNPPLPDPEGFYFAALQSDIEDGRLTTVTINDTPIILTRVNGTIHAFLARCPHASGDLAQGELHRGRINCPDHGYKFDVESGRPLWPPDEACRLKKYPIRQQAGRVFVQI